MKQAPPSRLPSSLLITQTLSCPAAHSNPLALSQRSRWTLFAHQPSAGVSTPARLPPGPRPGQGSLAAQHQGPDRAGWLHSIKTQDRAGWLYSTARRSRGAPGCPSPSVNATPAGMCRLCCCFQTSAFQASCVAVVPGAHCMPWIGRGGTR